MTRVHSGPQERPSIPTELAAVSGHTPGPLSAAPCDCDMPGCHGVLTADGEFLTSQISEADARLWAAAPDMLEALQGILAMPSLNKAMDPSDVERWTTVGMTDEEAGDFVPLFIAQLAIIKATEGVSGPPVGIAEGDEP